jgi:hypothetical protein
MHHLNRQSYISTSTTTSIVHELPNFLLYVDHINQWVHGDQFIPNPLSWAN